MRLTILLTLLCATAQAQSIQVADQTVKMDGQHTYYYALAEGDQLDLMVQLIAGRRIKTIEMVEVPGNTLFSHYDLDTLLNKTISIPHTGVYMLRFVEQGLGKKICHFKLDRKPASRATARMDTRVSWDMLAQPRWKIQHRSIASGIKTDVHSISGQVNVPASGMGMKNNRTSYRFELPANTVKWAYRIGVSQAMQQARQQDATKFRELTDKGATKLLAVVPETALAAFALGMAVQMTTGTGGEDIEYAIVDATNLQKFTGGADKYDAFIWQGAVTVDAQRRYSPLAGNYAFGLKNNNLVDDVVVNIDIEAVTETTVYEEETYLVPSPE